MCNTFGINVYCLICAFVMLSSDTCICSVYVLLYFIPSMYVWQPNYVYIVGYCVKVHVCNKMSKCSYMWIIKYYWSSNCILLSIKHYVGRGVGEAIVFCICISSSE